MNQLGFSLFFLFSLSSCGVQIARLGCPTLLSTALRAWASGTEGRPQQTAPMPVRPHHHYSFLIPYDKPFLRQFYVIRSVHRLR